MSTDRLAYLYGLPSTCFHQRLARLRPVPPTTYHSPPVSTDHLPVCDCLHLCPPPSTLHQPPVYPRLDLRPIRPTSCPRLRPTTHPACDLFPLSTRLSPLTAWPYVRLVPSSFWVFDPFPSSSLDPAYLRPIPPSTDSTDLACLHRLPGLSPPAACLHRRLGLSSPTAWPISTSPSPLAACPHQPPGLSPLATCPHLRLTTHPRLPTTWPGASRAGGRPCQV